MDIETLAEECAYNIHPNTVKAIIKVESAQNPNAINVNGKQYTFSIPKTIDEAVAVATELDNKGAKSIDVGLMQINSINLKKFNISYREAFEPCNNIRLGGKILNYFYGRAVKKVGEGQEALRLAFSGYNTGNFEYGFKNGYVDKILKAAGVQKNTKKIAETMNHKGRKFKNDEKVQAYTKWQMKKILRSETNNEEKEE